MARTVKDNKDVIQSYVLTTAKYDFNVWEKRLMYRLVEAAQTELHGVKLKDNMRQICKSDWGDVKISMPVSDILKDEKDENYTAAKKALKSLADKVIEYEDKDIWTYTHVINSPTIVKGTGVMNFTVSSQLWKVILDFTKGYRKLELKMAMEFSSVYTMRFYELLSGQKNPLTYKIEDIKAIFKLENKYDRVNNFVARVIEPAKKELKAKAAYYFDYKIIREGGKQKGKAIAFTFYPKYQEKNRDPELLEGELRAKVSGPRLLRPQIADYLKFSMNFTVKEISANKDLFCNCQKFLPDFIRTLAELRGKSREKDNPKGWIINALKGKLDDLQ